MTQVIKSVVDVSDSEDLFFQTETVDSEAVEKELISRRLTKKNVKAIDSLASDVYSMFKNNGFTAPAFETESPLPCRETYVHTEDQPHRDDYDDVFEFAEAMSKYRFNNLEARQQCDMCPVKMQCLAKSYSFTSTKDTEREDPEDPYLVIVRDQNYVWGGFDDNERKLIQDSLVGYWFADEEGPETVSQKKQARFDVISSNIAKSQAKTETDNEDS